MRSTANFIEYKGSPYKNSMKKIEIPGLNSDLKGTSSSPERAREDGTVSKQSYAGGVSISSRDKLAALGENTTARKTTMKKVVMHVNHFVPLFMQYRPLSKEVLAEFAKDYSGHNDFKNHMIDFDTKLIEVFNQRRERYVRKFFPQYVDGSPLKNTEDSVMLNEFDDFEEDQHDEEVSKRRAEEFQKSDLQEIRKLFKDICSGFAQQQDKNESVFAEERKFFLKQSLKDQEEQAKLRKQIEHLEVQLRDEKAYAFDLFIKEEVQKCCARAIVRYDTVTEQMLNLETPSKPLRTQSTIRRSPEVEDLEDLRKFKELYEDLLQEFECEKKLNQQMTFVLEDKVSELIAENGTLKLRNIQLMKDAEDFQEDIE